MPDLSSSQFSQGQLFEPGDPVEPHEMRRETFMRDPNTQFHTVGTNDLRASPPEWDPNYNLPTHTGTAAAALSIADHKKGGSNQFVGVQPIGPVNRENVSDMRANELSEKWEDLPPNDRLSESSQPYTNEIEDPGSTSYVHPTTAGHLNRHEDFVYDAQARGRHVPQIVKDEIEFANKRPVTVGDMRSEFDQLDWANKGREADRNPAHSAGLRQIPPASDVREVPSGLTGAAFGSGQQDLDMTARKWWQSSAPIDPDKETLK